MATLGIHIETRANNLFLYYKCSFILLSVNVFIVILFLSYCQYTLAGIGNNMLCRR